MLDLRDLEFLSALALHKHFARAAEACGVSQPAFSMRIRKIEERLDTQIVRRGNRFQGLTTEGETVVRHARRVLDEVKALEQEIRAVRGEISGELALGVIPTAMAYAGRLVQRLRQAHPGITVRLQAASSLAVQQGIEHGVFDAGITYTEGASPDLMRIEPIYEESYVLLAPRALAPRLTGQVGWAELAEVPLSLLEPGMQNRRILDQVFEDVGVHPHVVAETSGFTASLVMTVEGLAATVVPRVLLESLGGFEATVALPLVDPVVEKSVSLVTPVRGAGLPTVAALRRVLDV
ncbi:LysR family transcriptional regulator [Aliiruegeria haliotis]|uniref:LysR family transcriptional regulator n=1 Tax=Aliiruegeria haliotis TaxID=1280846 RepID=A0A2T0RY34_9RHOB|nr:LysR family transcriptional regulator [Aliiruegeria haliotis]PRY26081.1 LysR family transcriptional regulator [Aliiruegeria haliotis]